ncbi:hypothetical protein MKEN_00312300 [Mycena kentingensis (nom. inval.)]|nr:hypothetical protein MKEN_00312300 [Mycena kentingensis (nom. inval.)]
MPAIPIQRRLSATYLRVHRALFVHPSPFSSLSGFVHHRLALPTLCAGDTVLHGTQVQDTLGRDQETRRVMLRQLRRVASSICIAGHVQLCNPDPRLPPVGSQRACSLAPSTALASLRNLTQLDATMRPISGHRGAEPTLGKSTWEPELGRFCPWVGRYASYRDDSAWWVNNTSYRDDAAQDNACACHRAFDAIGDSNIDQPGAMERRTQLEGWKLRRGGGSATHDWLVVVIGRSLLWRERMQRKKGLMCMPL